MRRMLDLDGDDRVRLPAHVSARELSDDILRAGTLPRAVTVDGVTRTIRYLDKDAVLTQPGVLRRIGARLAPLVAPVTEALAVDATITMTLGTAVALESGLPLIVIDERDGAVALRGGTYRGMQVALITDIVLTGATVTHSVGALRAAGARVEQVLAMLDRAHGADARLAALDVDYDVLFTHAL